MHKNFPTCLFVIICLVATMLLNGCVSTEAPMADFTIPPRAISAEDLAKISTLRILINTQVENTTPDQDSACAAGLLHALVANALYQGRYYRVADIIWGDVYGASKAYDKAQVAQSGHGYSNFTTETLDDTARLTIDLTIKIQSQMQHRQEEIELKRTPYKRDDIVSKEKQERIPRSVADLDNVTVRKEKISPRVVCLCLYGVVVAVQTFPLSMKPVFSKLA